MRSITFAQIDELPCLVAVEHDLMKQRAHKLATKPKTKKRAK